MYKSEPIVLQSNRGSSFVNNARLSASYITRSLTFNNTKHVIYTCENEGPPFWSRNFLLGNILFHIYSKKTKVFHMTIIIANAKRVQ